MSNPFSPETPKYQPARHLKPIREGLTGRDSRLKQNVDRRSQERSAQAEHDRREHAISAAVHNLLQELQALEQQTQIDEYTQQIQEAVGPLANSNTTPDQENKPGGTFILPELPPVIQRYIAVLVMLAMLTGIATAPAYAQEGTPNSAPDTTTTVAYAAPETETTAAPEYSVSSYMETTSMTTPVLDKPSVNGTLLEKLGKYVTVGVLEKNAGNGAYTRVVFLDADGNLSDGYTMEAFLGAPTAKGEESHTALEQSLTQETEESQEAQEIRRVVVFASRQEVFQNPEDLTSKTGEILSKGAHIATKQQEINGIRWVYIEGKGWVIQAVESMNVVLGEDLRDLEADETLSPEEEKMGQLEKKVTPSKDLNVRDIPGTEGSSVVGTATGGTEYVALELDQNSIPGSTWAKIELADGTTGWIAVFSNGTQFSKLIDPNPPEGMISDADRAELEKNLDTDWAKPEIKQQALTVAQAFDPTIAHAEFTTVEGQRYYHQLVFFDKDGNVLYQTAVRGSGPESVQNLYEVQDDGSILPTEPVATATETGWESISDTDSESATGAETETLSSEEAAAATKELYPAELFSSIESQGGNYTYNEETGLFQATMPDGVTYLLMPLADANSESKDAEHTFFPLESADQTVTSSDGKVTITLATQKDNPAIQSVKFSDAFTADQAQVDEQIRKYLERFPEDFWPGEDEPAITIVLATSSQDSSEYTVREGETSELGTGEGNTARVVKVTRPDGGTTYAVTIFPPLQYLKGNYIVNPETNQPWERSRQEYLKYALSYSYLNALTDALHAALYGALPTQPKTEAEKAALQESLYGLDQKLGGPVFEITWDLDTILAEYYGL